MRKLAKETAKSVKGFAKETINSGATNGDGDAIKKLKHTINWGMYDKIVVEVKATKNKSFSVKRGILSKIKQEAKTNGMPVLQVVFVIDDKNTEEYVLLSKKDFVDIIDWCQFLQEREMPHES